MIRLQRAAAFAMTTLTLAWVIGGCPNTDTPTDGTGTPSTGDGSTDTPVRPPGGTNTGGVGGGVGGGSTNQGPQVFGDDHVLSTGSPRLTVIEYVDFQCPNCGRFARDTFPTIKQQYIDTGRVRWVLRHLPLTTIHANAQAAAEAAECAAGQGKFFEYAELLFENQSSLTAAKFEDHATALGLDVSAFLNCTATHASADRVNRDAELARDQGVPGTPAFFIGATLSTGHRSVAEFSALLDAALAALN